MGGAETSISDITAGGGAGWGGVALDTAGRGAGAEHLHHMLPPLPQLAGNIETCLKHFTR